MEVLLQEISENPSKSMCVPTFTRNQIILNPKDSLWGGELRKLLPAKLITAFLYAKDPLMVLAGQAYVSSQVRDKGFEIQEKASTSIRGNRKLTKANMSDALSAMAPTLEQTKRTAHILYELYEVQTVCFDAEAKTLWTVPEDLRRWSFAPNSTLWIDSRCEHMLDWSADGAKEIAIGQWLSDRDMDGWTIDWPVAEGSYEDIKQKLSSRNVTPRTGGARPKKEDWAKALGKCEAIEYLLGQE